MFSSYGEYSVSQITAVLEAAGLRLPMTAKRPERALVRSAIYKMLSNDYYVGIVTMKGEKVDGVHPAIIDTDTFERVQELLKAKKTAGTRSRIHEHYLKGSVYCGRCGGRMLYIQAKGKGGTYEYFRCFGRFNMRNECDAPHARTIQVEAGVIDEYITREFLKPYQREAAKIAIEHYVDIKVGAAKREIAKADTRLGDLKREQQHLLQMSYKGLVDEDVLAMEQARIRKEQNDIGKWKGIAERDSEAILDAMDDALKLLAEAPEAYQRATPMVRRLLNQAIWKRFWVIDGDRVKGELQPWAQALVSLADTVSEAPTTDLTANVAREEAKRRREAPRNDRAAPGGAALNP